MTARFPAQPELAGHPYFQFRNNVLYAEDVPLDHLAERLGTPLYVYSRAALKAAWQAYHSAVGQRPVLVCYGMKANSNLAVLKEFARLGAGFDIVSGGELKRALAVGADPARIVFSGVGKQAWEMRDALAAGSSASMSNPRPSCACCRRSPRTWARARRFRCGSIPTWTRRPTRTSPPA